MRLHSRSLLTSWARASASCVWSVCSLGEFTVSTGLLYVSDVAEVWDAFCNTASEMRP